MVVHKVLVDGVEYALATMEPPVSDRPASEWLAITPAVAASWLRFNQGNRKLRVQAADSQSRDMRGGKWAINGETIILSRPVREGEVEGIPKGTVLVNDGQHRLDACAQGRTPFVTLVAYGVDPATRISVDSGIARTVNDVLKMENKANAPILGSMIRRMLMWERGDRRFYGSKTKVTKAEVLEYLAKDEEALLRAAEVASWVRNQFKFCPPSVVAQAYYMTCKLDPEGAPWFFARFKDGAELPAGHPILALRTRFQNDNFNKKAAYPHQQLGCIFRAWNAYREGRDLAQIVQTVEDKVLDPK